VADVDDMVCLLGSSREFFDGDVGADTLIESEALTADDGKFRFMSLILSVQRNSEREEIYTIDFQFDSFA
jgi:hypothetical protein